jgi:hypothetical protein
MGYKADGFVIRVKCYADAAAVKQWLTPAVVVDTLLGPLDTDGYLGRVTHGSYAFAPPEPIGSTTALRQRAASWDYGITSLFAGDQVDPDVEIFLGLEPAGPRFAVGIAGADPTVPRRRRALGPRVERRAGRGPRAVRDRALRAGARALPAPDAHRARRSTGRRARSISTSAARGTSTPTPTAPRCSRASSRRRCRRARRASSTATWCASRSRRTCTTPPRWPPRARRTSAGSRRWCRPRPRRGWNEHGDEAAGPTQRRVVEGLTFYDDDAQVGYQALVVFPDGSVEEERWAAAEAIVRAGALPDGTPVNALRLIFPRRVDALAMHARAIAAGFEMTTYGDGGQLWQVTRRRRDGAAAALTTPTATSF